MVITTKKTLDAIVAGGYAKSWRKVKQTEYGHTVSRIEVDSVYFTISDETYGNESFLYFHCKKDGSRSPEIAEKIIRIIRNAGGHPGTEWSGGIANGSFDLRVKYFKGSRHWE